MRDRLLEGPAARALAAACDRVGLDHRAARLLRLHSNTVIHLPRDRAVARLAPAEASERVALSLKVTSRLAQFGFPTVRPKVPQHVSAGGFVVSFWDYEENLPAARSPRELALLLKRLHSLGGIDLELPTMQSPLHGVKRALAAHPEAFDGRDRSWLAAEIERCDEHWRSMSFTLPRGLIHGDAHPHNLLHTPRGVILGDWDHVACGPREWDLVQALYFARRFPTDGDDLEASASCYGWDLRDSPTADDLVMIREVSGLGSYIRTADVKPQARVELAYRIKTLQQKDGAARWHSPAFP